MHAQYNSCGCTFVLHPVTTCAHPLQETFGDLVTTPRVEFGEFLYSKRLRLTRMSTSSDMSDEGDRVHTARVSSGFDVSTMSLRSLHSVHHVAGVFALACVHLHALLGFDVAGVCLPNTLGRIACPCMHTLRVAVHVLHAGMPTVVSAAAVNTVFE